MQLDLLSSALIGHAVTMPKKPKVVSVDETRCRVLARDTKTRRIIVGMGSERFAIDFSSRITKLPPFTGDEPARVVPMNKNNAKEKTGIIRS
jgi:hypothetical protein